MKHHHQQHHHLWMSKILGRRDNNINSMKDRNTTTNLIDNSNRTTLEEILNVLQSSSSSLSIATTTIPPYVAISILSLNDHISDYNVVLDDDTSSKNNDSKHHESDTNSVISLKPGFFLVEMSSTINSTTTPTATRIQLPEQQVHSKYYYYPELSRKEQQQQPNREDIISTMWRTVALLSDIIIILVDDPVATSSATTTIDDHDDATSTDNHDITMSNRIHSFVKGLQHRANIGLSPCHIYIVVVSNSTTCNINKNIENSKWCQLLCNSTIVVNGTTSALYDHITIVNDTKIHTHHNIDIDTKNNNNNYNNNTIVDIIISKDSNILKNGTHTITDRTTYIHLIHETLNYYLNYTTATSSTDSNNNHLSLSLSPIFTHNVTPEIILDTSEISTILNKSDNIATIDVSNDNNTFNNDCKNLPNTRNASIGSAPKRIPFLHKNKNQSWWSNKSTLSFIRPFRNPLKTKTKQEPQSLIHINDNHDNNINRIHMEIDYIYQEINNIQNQQEENSFLFDRASFMSDEEQQQGQFQKQSSLIDFVLQINPIIDRFISMLSVVQSTSLSNTSTLITSLNTLYQHIIMMFQYQFDIVRDHYGTMYETMIDRNMLINDRNYMNQIQSIQDRIIQQYKKDLENAMKPLQRLKQCIYTKINDDTFDKILHNQLDITLLITKLRTDINDITELRIDIVDIENNNSDNDTTTNGIIPKKIKQYVQRHERIYKFGINLMKRCIVLGMNYIQGYITIQSIKRIAIQQERDIPKFPLF